MKVKRALKPKRRLAPQSVRDHAAQLVRWYQSKEPIAYAGLGPDGQYLRKPIDGDFLAARLDRLAKTGLFEGDSVAARRGRNALIHIYFAELYPGTHSKEQAIAEVAARLRCSEKTVATVIGPVAQKK